MAKPKEGRENEYYKGIIRQQRAEIIRLKRRIRELEKESLFAGYDDQDDFFEPAPEVINNCPKCQQGYYTHFEINGRKFLICSNCRDRVKV
jgi:hypothetical protein